MAEKRYNVTRQELRSMLPWLLAINAVYFALLLVLFFAFGMNYSLLLGGVWGNIAAVGNSCLMSITAENALRRGAKSAQRYMNTLYCVRYLGLFLVMTAVGVLPCIDLVTAVVPLFFPRVIITIRTLWETRPQRKKDK